MNNIGEKIKKARQSKHITQAQLCGSKITRNLLSLIENGKAAPSVKTLSYIAGRLDIPVGYFFTKNDEEESLYEKLTLIIKIKKYYKIKQYDKCISLCSQIEKKHRDDEINMLLGNSYFYNALQLAEEYNISNSKKSLRMAGESAQNTIYLNDDFNGAIDYYILLLSSLDIKKMPQELFDVRKASSYIPIELIKYIERLNCQNINSFNYSFINNYHKIHLSAQDKIKSGNFYEAINILNELTKQNDIPFYMRYFVYDDIEMCSNQINDFYSAYKAAKIKLSLVELIKS